MNSVTDKVLEKYPQYRDTPYADLTLRLAERYPQYLERPDFAEEVKQFQASSPAPNAVQPFEMKPDAQAGGVFQPSQFSSGAAALVGTAASGDADFTIALAEGAKAGAKKTAGFLHDAGKFLTSELADFGAEMTGQNVLHPEGNQQETEGKSAIDALIAGEPIPAAPDMRNLPTPLRIVGRASQGLIETTPHLAAVAGLQALGVPAPIAAAAIFGLDEEEGFNPKHAAIAAAIPFVGKYSGEITGAIAKRLGVSSERALKIYNESGGAAGAVGYLSTIQASEILNLPPEQRKDATIEAIASNIGFLPLSFSGGGRLPENSLAAKVDKIESFAPLTAEALRVRLGEVAAQRVSLEPTTGERVQLEGRRTEINLMQRRADIENFVTELDAIGTRMRDATAAEKEAARQSVITKFEARLQQIGRPERPVVPEGPSPEERLTAVAEIRRANALTIRQIQDLFPKAQLNRERARELRNAAWGELDAQTPLTPKPVVPKFENAPKAEPAPDTGGTVKAPAVRAAREAVSETPEQLQAQLDEALGRGPEPKTTTAFDSSQVATVEVPVEKLKLSQDVPNFKAGASPETGVVEGQQLQGKFERVGTAPIIVWERLNGDLEVISGRHRLDLARRSGEKTIPSQIVRESHGFTKEQAMTLDSEANIRDAQGEVSDYATYFKNTEITEAEARARGLLSRTKGQAGWHLAKNASPDVYAGWKAGKFTDSQAAAIAAEAPGNADLQRVAIPAAIRGDSPQLLSNLLRAVKSESGGSTKQLDLLGNDDAAMLKMQVMAERATTAQRELVEQVRSVQSAARRPEIAKRFGVDVSNPEGVLRKVNELKAELERWQNWPLHPDLVAKARGESAPAPAAQPAAKVSERGTAELFTAEQTPFNLSGEKAKVVEMVEPKTEQTQFGPDTLSQNELFAINKVVESKDPGKSADAAQAIHGDPALAAKVIERQLRVIDSDPDTRKSFTKEQRQRLKEVVALLRERASGETDAAGAISLPGPGLAPTAAPAPPVLSVKSQSQIIRDLSAGMGTPIRFGRLRTSKFAGYFMRRANLIGAKKANDLPIIAHEAGHKLDAALGLSTHPPINSELMHLGDPTRPDSRSSWTPKKSLDYRRGEGIAEFVRYWLTDPVEAVRLAPQTSRYFESALEANKDLRDTFKTAQEDIRAWRNAPPQARLRSQISVGSNPNKTPYSLDQLTRDVVDDLHYIRLAVDDAQRGATLKPSENPYLLARNLRGSFGMADTFIRKGVVDFATKEVRPGTSLQDVLKPVAGRINDFRTWIVSKQAQELHRQGKETGLVPSDVDAVVKQFDGDADFQAAFQHMKTWNNALLQYGVDSGYISASAAAAMRKMNQDYVPFHRVFEIGAGEMGQESSGIGRGLNVGKAASLKGRHGSTRDIIDPLESLVKNAYAVITASEKNAVSIALADLGSKPGMGKWVEHIATPKEGHKVALDKIREQLEDVGADLSGVPDDLILSFYSSSAHAPFGENIIKVNRSGKLDFYRLDKDLFNTFHALDADSSGFLLKMLSAPAQLLRAGVTTTADFAFFNAVRDMVSASIISRYSVLPFEATIRGVAAVIGNRKLVAEWAAAGGKQAIEANYFDRDKLQAFLKERITKDLTPADQATIVLKSPLTALRLLTGTLEEITRVGEYQLVLKKLLKNGMDIGDARRLAAYESRDLQDFGKSGARTKAIRQMTPFANATLQGGVRFAQSLKERPLQTVLKGMAFATIPKLLEQAVNWDDEDYWDRPQWERDNFYLIPVGKDENQHTKFLRIPVPFEAGTIFASVPGRFLQWAKTNNPEAVKGIPALIAKTSIPNPTPPLALVVFENFLSGPQGWSVFRGQPVVPDSIATLPVELQFTEQTSLTAKKLGRALGFSPMKVDSIITGSAGGLAKQTVHQGIDRGISAATGEERTAQRTTPLARFFTTPAGVSSQAVEDFYAKLDTLRKESAREKRAGEESKMDLSDLAGMERDARLMNDLRKEALETKDPAERQRLHLEIVAIAKEWTK